MAQFIHIAIIVLLGLILFILVKRRLIQIDLSFPWFVSIIALGLASTIPGFVNSTAGLLGILYPPIAVVFMVVFLLLGIIVVLSIAVSRLRHRQIQMMRELAAQKLDEQERDLQTLSLSS